jgi:hypothetical protein
MTLGKGRDPAGVNRELLMNSAAGVNIRKPSQVGIPTSVGFATSAHAKCAFLVLQSFAGLTAVENQVGTRQTAVLPST